MSAGARHMVAAAIYFSLMAVLVKLAGQRLHAFQIVLGRGVVCAALSLLWIQRSGIRPIFGHHRTRLILRGVLGSFGLLGVYYGLVLLPLAEAMVIQYTHPIMVAILALVLLGERPDRRLAVAVPLSLAGVVVITQPALLFGEGGTELPTLGVIAAFAGAFGSACAYTLVRSLKGKEPPLVIVLYFPLITIPVSLPLAIYHWTWPVAWEWLVLLGVGVATQLAQVHLTHGLALEAAGKATSFGYVQVLLAAVWGALFFGEVPDKWTVIGSVLIVVGTLSLVAARRRHARSSSQ